jgi:hypothetical protein
VDTPGLEAGELEVEVEGHTIVVLGKPEHGHEGAAFSFTFQLPPDTNLERLHATFLDGVLTVKGPLLEATALHSWMVWCLILDCELEHPEATLITDLVLAGASHDVGSPVRARNRRRRRRFSHHGIGAPGNFRERHAHI